MSGTTMGVRRIGVVGGTGTTGAHVVLALRAQGHETVAFARNASTPRARLDLTAPEAELVAAFAGLDALYVIPPRLHPSEDLLSMRVFEAAESARVERVVFHSVMHAATSSVPHHRRKARAEEALRRLHIRWSVLQPNTYAQNYLRRVRREPDGLVLVSPWSTDGPPLAMVDLDDLAIAASALLRGHVYVEGREVSTDYGTFEAAGPELLNNREAAASLSRAWGVHVESRAVAAADYLEPDLPEEERSDSERYFEHYGSHGFPGSPLQLEWLIGQAPSPLEAVARRITVP